MGAITKQLQGKVAHSKSRGKAYVAEINAALSPASIAKEKAETQKLRANVGKR